MPPKAVRRMAVNGPTELSSRPERSAVEGPAVSLPILTQNSVGPPRQTSAQPEMGKLAQSGYRSSVHVCIVLIFSAHPPAKAIGPRAHSCVDRPPGRNHRLKVLHQYMA